MATLISMEYTPSEAKDQVSAEPSDGGPKFPWGLEISLDDDSLDKLGVKTLPPVGTEVTIIAKATVSSTSERATEKDGNCASMCLQITDMQLGGAADDLFGRAAEAMYGAKQKS